MFIDKDAALSRVEPAPQRALVSDALDLQIEGRRGGAVRQGIDAVWALCAGRPAGDSGISDEGSYYAYVQAEPDSIGVGEDTFWPALFVVHEIGHFVDHVGLPGTGYQSGARTMPEMDEVMRLIEETRTVRLLTGASTYGV